MRAKGYKAGSPTMGYCESVENLEREKSLWVISQIVVEALATQPGEKK